MMPLKDYLEFERIAPQKLKEGFYFQSRNLNPKNYVYWNRIGLSNTTSIDMNFKKVKADWGICIDIYPIINISDDEKIRKKETRKLRLYHLLSLKYYHKATMKNAPLKEKCKKLVHLLLPDFINIYLSKRIMNYFNKYNLLDTKECTEVLEYFSLNAIYNTSVFKDYTELQFEDKKFKVIKNWDEFLKVRYGDYMTPPKDKSKHSDDPNVFIDFNHSYKELWKK